MTPKFEWYPQKAVLNKAKHGITFEQGITAFDDPEFLDIFDAANSVDEDRMIRIGQSDVGIMVIVYVEHEGPLYRIISARKATRKERSLYYDTQRKNRLQ